MASIRNSPRSAASANSAVVDAASSVIGFSHSTAFPAARARRVCSSWSTWGGGDVHDVDLGVGDQRRVGAVGPPAELGGEVRGPLLVAGTGGHQPPLGYGEQVA